MENAKPPCIHLGHSPSIDYTAFCDDVTELDDLYINELSIYGTGNVTLQFDDGQIVLYDDETSFSLVRKNSCLVVNEIKPPFYPIFDSDVWGHKSNEEIDDWMKEEKVKYTKRYETPLTFRKKWILKGSTLDVRFFNLHTEANPSFRLQLLNRTNIALPISSCMLIEPGVSMNMCLSDSCDKKIYL